LGSRIAFFGIKERYVPVSAFNGEAYHTGCIGEESDISCFSARPFRSTLPSPGKVHRPAVKMSRRRKGYAMPAYFSL